MPRSSKKYPYIVYNFWKKIVKNQKFANDTPVWKRSCTIHPHFVGTTFLVHNGQKLVKLVVTPDMVGFPFGAFVPTKQLPNHTAIKTNNKIAKK